MQLPTTAEGIRAEFWDTDEGEVLAEQQWAENEHQALSLTDAARLLGLDGTSRSIMYVMARLPLYRRPRSAMHYRRPAYRRAGEGTNRAWYVLESDVNELLAKR